MSFSQLKKNRGNFQDLSKKLADTKNSGGGGKDDRYWSLKVDEAGNGYAVIRFLPAPENEEYPFVKRYSHVFKDDNTNKWYIEKSLTTIGQQDPIAEENTRLWNSGIEENKNLARKRKRNLKYISNILVIKDKAAPENEGKVFLYEYGSKIFDMIQAAIEPQFDDEKPLNPFDLWDGADFNLKAYNGANKQRSYDRSSFSPPRPVFEDDAALEKLWKSEYSLQALLAPSEFKSYDELKTRLEQVLGYKLGQSSEKRQADSIDEEFKEPARKQEKAPAAPAARREEPQGDDLSEYAQLLADFD